MKFFLVMSFLLVSKALYPSPEDSYREGKYLESISKKVQEMSDIPKFYDLFF